MKALQCSVTRNRSGTSREFPLLVSITENVYMHPTTPEGILHDIYEHLTPPDCLGSELAAVGALSIYRPRDAKNGFALANELLHSALSYARAAQERGETPRLGEPPHSSRPPARTDRAFAQELVGLFSARTRIHRARSEEGEAPREWILAQVDGTVLEMEAWVAAGRKMARARLRRLGVSASHWLRRMVYIGELLTDDLRRLEEDCTATLVYDDWIARLLPEFGTCAACGGVGVLSRPLHLGLYTGDCVLCLSQVTNLELDPHE